MKFLFAALIVVSFLAEAWSITCYRCGGASTSCKVAGNATVQCDNPSMPDSVFACRVYTVNYTSLNSVITIKSCCFYEDCNDDPCKTINNAVCSKMASCQSDKCNYNYDLAKASQQPTLPSPTDNGVVFSSVAGLVMSIAAVSVFYLSI